MDDFVYREENKDRKNAKYKEVTACESLYPLLTLFIIECLARTIGTEEFDRLKRTFDEILHNWDDIEGARALENFTFDLFSKRTLFLRFSYIKKEFKNIVTFASNFMIYALDPNTVEGMKTREKISHASNRFNLYIEFRGRILPSIKSGTRLLGIFGAKNDKYPCIFYTIDMATIDNSLGSSVEYQNKVYYYIPSNKEFVKKDMNENLPIEKQSPQIIKLFSNNEGQQLESPISLCDVHTTAETINLSCGYSHCVPCLLDNLEIAKSPKCPCGFQISHRDLNILKAKKSKDLGFIVGKTESNYSQISSVSYKKPPPPLLPKKITSTRQVKVNLFEDDLQNKCELNVANFKAIEIAWPENEENLQKCSICGFNHLESEFKIKCNCSESICFTCRVCDEVKCFRCKKKYSEVNKLAIEILKITKSNNY